MKKRKLILIGLLIWNFNSVFGQNFCFTPSTSSNLSLNSSYQMRSSNNNSYCLKIYFHVIRRSNGTGGQSVESVEEAFNILNQDFNPQNISFNWDSQIDYIDNDSYYSSPTTAIFNVNNHQDGIDIYLYDDSSSAGGRANGVGQSSEFWVSGSYWKTPNNPLTRSHVISHEMGHVLYLWHTHHGTYNEGGNDNPCPELVNGSNSATCGDYVTDTPADPHLQFDVNQSTCQWNSSGTDANGNQYNPDEKNVMSYTDINCMEYFTEGQGERMRNAISTLSYLQQTITNNCIVQKLSSIEQLCYTNNKTLTISNLGNNTTTWQVSSNATILSSNSNSITIRASSSNSTGNGWVRAVLSNGITLQEDFNVGSPSPNNLRVITTGNGIYVFSRTWQELYAFGGDEIEWSFNTSVMTRNSGPNSIMIYPTSSTGSIRVGIRTRNECGYSQWKYKYFTIYQTTSDGGIGIMH
jgi:hypothetical protein